MSPKYAPILFGFLLSGIMSLIVSGVSTVHVLGLSEGLFWAWMETWCFSWPVAFLTVLVVGPFVRRLVAKLTKEG